jgi:hypothetical protein
MNEERPVIVRVEAPCGEPSAGAATWEFRGLERCALRCDRPKRRTVALRASVEHVRSGHSHWPKSECLTALELSKDLQLTDVDPAVHDRERSRFAAFAIALSGAMYVTVIGLASALITDSVWLGPG